MNNVQEWMSRRRVEDDYLYERYGKPLEQDHWGEIVAIGPDGTVVFENGRQSGEIAREAIEKFGRGNFALTRVGDRVVGELLTQ